MSRDLWAWVSIAAHASRSGRQCFTLAPPRLRIVWTAGGRVMGPSEVWWTGQNWTAHLDRAAEYTSREDADPDLRAARESVQRGVQRGAVELREVG